LCRGRWQARGPRCLWRHQLLKGDAPRGGASAPGVSERSCSRRGAAPSGEPPPMAMMPVASRRLEMPGMTPLIAAHVRRQPQNSSRPGFRPPGLRGQTGRGIKKAGRTHLGSASSCFLQTLNQRDDCAVIRPRILPALLRSRVLPEFREPSSRIQPNWNSRWSGRRDAC
jgi:hypothetical protein